MEPCGACFPRDIDFILILWDGSTSEFAAATASTSFRIRQSFHYNGNVQNSFPKRIKAFPSRSIITASLKARRPQNVPGEFFVDHTCIDCDTCRWMAPENFTRASDMSAVFKQPSCEEERLRALQALLPCPTSSIHTDKPPHDILEVQRTFPIPIDEHTLPVDHSTAAVEIKLEGSGPWSLGDDVTLVHTPGHSENGRGQYACYTNHIRCFLRETTLQWVNLAGPFLRDITSFQCPSN